MGCFFDNRDGVRSAVLMFKRSQLLYDIKNCAYIEGHVMTDADPHMRHMVQDAGEEGNVDRITRVMDIAMARCREMLYAYTKHEVNHPELDDMFKERKVYGIVMTVPNDFSQTTLTLLERTVHEYIVDVAMADWMSITNTAKAEIWAIKAKEMEDEIRRNLHRRMGGNVRIRMHPF